MDLQALETLEERVNKAVAVIAGLKDEKKKLEADNQALRRQLEELARKLQTTETEGAALAELRAENQRQSAVQAETRRRLADVIAKLEKFKD